MIATAKVQQTKSNTVINIPKDIREIFNINKGDKVIIETTGKNEITIKKVV